MTRTYPADEFDVDDPGTGRRGAHRAKPNPLVAVVPLVLVTVAVVAVIVGTMTLLGGPGTAPSVAGSDIPASEPVEPPASETTAPPPSESATPTESATPEPTVDQSLPVTVLNGTGAQGLAGDTATKLTEAGFNVVTTDNFSGGEAPATTVFYAAEAQSATADAIVAELGVGVTELDPAQGEGLTVVLGADYSP